MNRDLAIETLADLLKQGKSAEIPADGYSMFPTLRPGDKVMVNPLAENVLPVKGILLVAKSNNTLVLHRLVEIRNDKDGNALFVTRGDSMRECDIPLRGSQIIGIAGSYKRNDRHRHINTRVPSETEYKINRVRLWVWLKMKRINLTSHIITAFLKLIFIHNF